MVNEPYVGLHAKYLEMLDMRRAHANGEESDARARMRALARRFPGALREIDTLPLPEIEARIEALARGEQPAWAQVLTRFHGWMRLALRIKRVHARNARLDDVSEWIRAQPRRSPDEPTLEELDDDAIEGILRPPSGRLSQWVLLRIASDRGLTLEEVSGLAFEPQMWREETR